MDQYTITGMSCAACQVRVEKAVIAVAGVESCAVSLLTNSMGVEGNASPAAIIAAVEAAGYGATQKTSSKEHNSPDTEEESLKDTETPKMKKRLIASCIFLVPLMYVSMGHMMWNWPLPDFLDGNHVGMGICELLLSGMILVINQRFFVNGFKGLFHKSPNMDTLVALGSGAAFVYSIYALFAMTDAILRGNAELVIYYMDQFYFESAGMILTLITVGKMLEARSKGKTTNALKSLMNLSPKTAVMIEDGTEITVPIDEVKVGDRFVVRPGDSIPVDGIVLEGESAVNESSLTGESIPVDKAPKDRVSAATINTSGHLVCQATRVGEDTTLAAIIKMVSDAAATKAPIAKIADKVSGIFVPTVLGISLITFVIWLIVGQTVGYAIERAVSVLVISCPCALGLATPVAIMVGNGVGARAGILFKNAAALEQAGKTKIVALDKTGTITTGIMKVTDLIPCSPFTEEELLTIAYSLETKSEHPLSKAIIEYARVRNISARETTEFEILSGNGLRAKLEEDVIAGGNVEYIERYVGSLDEQMQQEILRFSKLGKTPILFAKDGKLIGIIAIEDVIKSDSREAIAELKQMGLRVVMLTGDNEITAAAIAEQAGVDEVIASVKPDGKEAEIRKLKEHGIVAMVGDGINDAPALTRADLGIAIGAGTDIAIDAADIVLMKNSIHDVTAAIRISKATLKNIHENLFWAFFYNCLGIPLAAGCYVAAFGWTLNPMFGAAAMGLSSFCVVTNALRLNFLKPYEQVKPQAGERTQEKTENETEYEAEHNSLNKSEKNKLYKTEYNPDNKSATNITDRKERGKKQMKITVNGMMCAHCEAHVKKALEAIEGIESVEASHEENMVTITNSKDVDTALIKSTIEEAGYEYVGIIE